MKKNKIASLILAAAFTASALPAAVSADSNSPDEEEFSFYSVSSEPGCVDYGVYENMSWSLMDTGALCLYGSYENKALPDFSDTERPPFEKYRSRIKTVYLSEHITRIGENTFKGYTNLSRVTVFHKGSWGYSRLRTIGKGAFEGCTALKKFSVPFTVTNIGENAFRNCSGLTHLKLGLTCTIGAEAFAGCPLSHIDILKGYNSKDFYTAESGLPADSSLYHNYTASAYSDKYVDVFKEWGEIDDDGTVYLRAPSFDRCETENCPLNTLCGNDLVISYHPERIVKIILTNGGDINTYSPDINRSESGDYFSIYDPVNDRELVYGLDYVEHSDFNGYAYTPEEAENAGLSVLEQSSCNEYFFDLYYDVTVGDSTVTSYLNDEYGYFKGGSVQISNDTPALGETVNIKVALDPGYKVTRMWISKWYHGVNTDIYNGTDSEYSFVADDNNASYFVRVDVEGDSKAKVSSFVDRLYSLLLGRQAEADGLADWTNRLVSGEATSADIVYGIANSQEFANRGLSDYDMINIMYASMLARGADDEGLQTWRNAMANGMTVTGIINGFSGSQEFANICAEYGILPGSITSCEPRDRNSGLTGFVSRMYTQALGRSYDVDGLNTWTGAYLRGEQDARGIAYGFIFSQEFKNKNLNDNDYVEVLYKTFFGRASDEGGKANWLNALANGESRESVLDGFLGSQEFANLKAGFGV